MPTFFPASLTVLAIVFFPASFMMPVIAAGDRLVARSGTPPNAFSRRALLALTAATSASGFANAQAAPLVRSIPLCFKDLHPDLEGLRILQLSARSFRAPAGRRGRAPS